MTLIARPRSHTSWAQWSVLSTSVSVSLGLSATDMTPTHILLVAGVALCLVLVQQTSADSVGDYDLPGPGLAFGGIPYGSVSGNLAAYFQNRPAGGNYNRGYKSYNSAARGYNNPYYRNNRINYNYLSRDFD